MKNGHSNGHANGHDDLAAKARPHLQRLAEIDDEMRASWKAFNTYIGEKRREVYDAARRDNIEVKSLKAVHEHCKLDRKLRAKLDPTEVAQFETLAAVFAGTDFGDHCRDMAEERRAGRHVNGSTLRHPLA